MQQKEVLLIVGVLVVGLFLSKQGAFSSTDASSTTGNAVRMTCEDPCKDIVDYYKGVAGNSPMRLSQGERCSDSFCSTCTYRIDRPDAPREIVTHQCIPHYTYVDNRWLTPVGYSSPNKNYWSNW